VSEGREVLRFVELHDESGNRYKVVASRKSSRSNKISEPSFLLKGREYFVQIG